MEISYLLEYLNLVTLGICLCLGYTIKQSLDFIPNKYIPLIMLCVGTVINCLCNLQNIDATTVLGGMMSGLASTGLYEAMKNLINKDEKKGDE